MATALDLTASSSGPQSTFVPHALPLQSESQPGPPNKPLPAAASRPGPSRPPVTPNLSAPGPRSEVAPGRLTLGHQVTTLQAPFNYCLPSGLGWSVLGFNARELCTGTAGPECTHAGWWAGKRSPRPDDTRGFLVPPLRTHVRGLREMSLGAQQPELSEDTAILRVGRAGSCGRPNLFPGARKQLGGLAARRESEGAWRRPRPCPEPPRRFWRAVGGGAGASGTLRPRTRLWGRSSTPRSVPPPEAATGRHSPGPAGAAARTRCPSA